MNIRKNRGITLIALVITIVILVILAGITINIVVGEKGIFKITKDAKEQYEIEEIKEKIIAEIAGKQIENEGNISDDILKEILEKYGTLSGEEKLIDKTLTTKNGNYKIKVSDIINGITSNYKPNQPTNTKIANEPDISGFDKIKTYYVEWNLNEAGTEYIPNEINMKEVEEQKKTISNNWYDYTAGVNKWANIKTTGGGNDCYWVWIPRYAYKITYTSETSKTSGTIDVVFLKDQTNTDMKGNDVTSSTYVDSQGNTGAYIVHPAFTWKRTKDDGTQEQYQTLGIWVAKYEASSSNVSENTISTDLNSTGGGNVNNLQVRVKPNVTSWRGISLGNIFMVCQNLTESNNSVCGTNNTKNINIDSHMMKNMEWGAVAYLSRSMYGKNSPVWNNPYYNNTTYFSPITGLCGKGENKQDLSTTNLSNTCKYNEIGGENASTTGNIYGIYDMAGGANEVVAGVLSSKLSNGSYYNFSNIDTKYYDTYDNENSTYGDAGYETSKWDSDDYVIPNNSYFTFSRGGRAGRGINAGIFSRTCR